MPGASSPSFGQRTSPYSSASPLEREVMLNNLNSYKNSRSSGGDLSDLKSKLLGTSPQPSSQNYSGDSNRKSSFQSDFQPRSSLLGDSSRRSPLIEDYTSRSSRSPRLAETNKTSADDYGQRSALLSDAKSFSRGNDYSKKSSTLTEEKKSPRLDDYGRRSPLPSEMKRTSVSEDNVGRSSHRGESKNYSGIDELGRRSPLLSEERKTSPQGDYGRYGDSNASNTYRKPSLSKDDYTPRRSSPLLTDSTPGRSYRSSQGEDTQHRKSSLHSELNSRDDYSARKSSSYGDSNRKSSLLGETETRSAYLRDLKPPTLSDSRSGIAGDRSSYIRDPGTPASRSHLADYPGSKSYVDSKFDDIGRSDRRPSLLKDKQPLPSHKDVEVDEDTVGMRHPTKDAKTKKRKRKNPITANLSGTRYDIVRQMVEHIGFTISKDDDPNSYLIWNDSFVSTERISELKPFQRINHFPGMGEICRKDCLARNMAKMAKVHPEEFNFVPKSWILPSEYSAFQNYARELKKKKKSKTFIAKPANGAMGNGISLFRNPEKIPQNDHTIIQEYIDKPLLIEGFKCDMRIYVLVTCCDPLRIFLYNDGLLRMGTEKYTFPTDGNIDHLFMHLTNYSVNKHNEQYEKSHTIDTGSKRSLRYFNDYLRKHDYDVAFLWRNITDMLVKTLIVALPHMLHAYRMCRPGQSPGSDSVCFELLGFDVMLDKKLRPWLIEVNRSPSFGTDEKLDYDIKSGLIEHSLRLLNIKASDKRKNIAAQKAQTQRRLMRPNKRLDNDTSELEKKRQSVERKKEELKDMLARIRKDAAREDFENRNSGSFKRIFPPDDKFRREKYAALVADAFSVFLSGRATSLQQEINRAYNNKYREEDVLDMLAQCEADERDGHSITVGRPLRGPKPLQSMPTLSRENIAVDDDDEDEDYEDSPSPAGSPSLQRKGGPGQRSRSSTTWGSRPVSGRPGSSGHGNQRSRSLNRALNLKGGVTEEALMMVSQKDREEDLTRRTLVALNDMRIKFPGKTDDEADFILDKLHENWKFHKPRIASYWLVKLDSIKRRKVIDIVRSNVRAVLQRTWKCPDIDTLRLYRIFSRVFNRLLWSHGQGLWNCFQTSGNSWETIFSKSTETISASEMACCRRIVQLCRDCLLIVYQFAAEAKNSSNQHLNHEAHESSSRVSRQ